MHARTHRPLTLKGALVAGWLAVASVAHAHTPVYIPNNSTTIGAAGTALFNAASGHVQYSLIALEVGSSAQQLTSTIGFVPTVTGTFTATWCQIRMGRGTTNSLSTCYANNAPALTIVYEGPLSYAAVADTWSTIKLQSSYATDGNANVIIDIRWMGGSNFVPVRTSSPAFGQRVYDITSSNPVTATCAAVGPENTIPRTRIVIHSGAMLLAADDVKVGATSNITLSGLNPNESYQMATALGQSALLQVTLTKTLRMDLDPLFFLTASNLMPGFVDFGGKLTANGDTVAPAFTIPNLVELVGLNLVHGAITFDATFTITDVTNTHVMPIVP